MSDRHGADLEDLLADVHADLVGTTLTLARSRDTLTSPTLTLGEADEKERRQEALAAKGSRSELPTRALPSRANPTRRRKNKYLERGLAGLALDDFDGCAAMSILLATPLLQSPTLTPTPPIDVCM